MKIMNGRVLLSVLLLTVGCFVLAAPPVAMEVSTESVMVLPPRNTPRGQGINWQGQLEVEQGEILKFGTTLYMVQSAGTTGTNAPVLFVPGVETNGTAVLRCIERGPRQGFVLMVESNGVVRVSVNSAAASGEGLMLDGRLSHWSESDRGCPQGAIWAATDSGTNRVTVMEW